jgi:hypothetical protein
LSPCNVSLGPNACDFRDALPKEGLGHVGDVVAGAFHAGVMLDSGSGRTSIRSDQPCASIAAAQFGLISHAQAVACGMSPHAIHRRVAARRWDRVLPGVYRLVGAPSSWEQRLMAAVVWAPEAVVSHRGAAALWRLDGFDRGPVDFRP